MDFPKIAHLLSLPPSPKKERHTVNFIKPYRKAALIFHDLFFYKAELPNINI